MRFVKPLEQASPKTGGRMGRARCARGAERALVDRQEMNNSSSFPNDRYKETCSTSKERRQTFLFARTEKVYRYKRGKAPAFAAAAAFSWASVLRGHFAEERQRIHRGNAEDD